MWEISKDNVIFGRQVSRGVACSFPESFDFVVVKVFENFVRRTTGHQTDDVVDLHAGNDNFDYVWIV